MACCSPTRGNDEFLGGTTQTNLQARSSWAWKIEILHIAHLSSTCIVIMRCVHVTLIAAISLDVYRCVRHLASEFNKLSFAASSCECQIVCISLNLWTVARLTLSIWQISALLCNLTALRQPLSPFLCPLIINLVMPRHSILSFLPKGHPGLSVGNTNDEAYTHHMVFSPCKRASSACSFW